MIFSEKKNLEYLFLFSLIIIISYFIGFFYEENAAGGAQVDFENVKRNITLFKNNSFIDSIILTTTENKEIFRSTRTPGFYIFNKYLNPFTYQIKLFQFYITILSLLIPVVFYFSLKIKYSYTNANILFLLSFTILLSPFLRSSAFWGIEENFGILVATISSFFFLKYIKENNKYLNILFLFLTVFFSSACVYSDQKLIIIPFIIFLKVILSNKNTLDKICLIFLFLILAIPFIYLIKLWGGIVPPGDAERRGIDNVFFYPNYHHFLYSISIISFYFIPFLFLIKSNKFDLFFLFKKKINFYLTILFLLLLLKFIFTFNLGNMYSEGGGVFQKISIIFLEDIFFRKLFLSIIFFISWIIFLITLQANSINIIIMLFFPFFSIFISPAIFQEYFDPIIFLLIFIYLDIKLKFDSKNVFLFSSYFSFFLFACIIYKYIFL